MILSSLERELLQWVEHRAEPLAASSPDPFGPVELEHPAVLDVVSCLEAVIRTADLHARAGH